MLKENYPWKAISLVGNEVRLVLIEFNGETHTITVPVEKVTVVGKGKSVCLFIPINDCGEDKTAVVDRSGALILANAK